MATAAALLLAAAAFAAMVLLLPTPRSGWAAIGAALLLGLAGYAWQARPGLAGAPKVAEPRIAGDAAAAMIADRRTLAGGAAVSGNSWVVVADALTRHGAYAEAAGVLLGAVGKAPDDGEAWTALGNVLVAHADGTLTPASLYAFRQAAAAAPGQPGPAYFLGLALAQSGRFDEGRAIWARLLAASPPDAPWRPGLAMRLRQLDALIVMRQQTAGAPGAPN